MSSEWKSVIDLTNSESSTASLNPIIDLSGSRDGSWNSAQNIIQSAPSTWSTTKFQSLPVQSTSNENLVVHSSPSTTWSATGFNQMLTNSAPSTSSATLSNSINDSSGSTDRVWNSAQNVIQSAPSTLSTTNFQPSIVESTSNENSFVQSSPSITWSDTEFDPMAFAMSSNGDALFNIVLNANGEPVLVENAESNVQGGDLSEWRAAIDSMIHELTNSAASEISTAGATDTENASANHSFNINGQAINGDHGHLSSEQMSSVGMSTGPSRDIDDMTTSDNMKHSTESNIVLHG